jgi:Protein of unknown function (DUF2892)
MAFARFMISPPGRLLRIAFGVALVFYGFRGMGGSGWGIALAAFGTIGVITAVFNLCLLAPLLGVPFRGRDVVKS